MTKYVEVGRPEGNIDFIRGMVYDNVECEEKARGMRVCDGCLEKTCIGSIGEAICSFAKNPNMYLFVSRAMIIDGEYIIVNHYLNQKEAQVCRNY